MLIDSNFHDFYDSAAVYGIDKTCVYKREESVLDGEFDLDRKSYWSSRWYQEEKINRKHVKYEIEYFLVGFCGNLHPLVRIEKHYQEDLLPKIEQFHCYSMESVKEFNEKEKLPLSKDKYRWRYNPLSEEGLKYFFNADNYSKMKEYFHHHRAPVFVYGYMTGHGNKEKLVLNPRLKSYGFGQVRDAPTAFQDIFMFISGVLGVSPKETISLSDKEMAAKRGHNGKYSFRKPPKAKK